MDRSAELLLEIILQYFDRRISELKAEGDFLGAEKLDRFKREYLAAEGIATNWTRRAFFRNQ